MCLTERTYVLGKLHSGMSDNAVGHEPDVYESPTYSKYVFKQKGT